ncbi:MAG: helix-turn-helix domain containing protein [Candidatus Atribacteria bacterium]|nr:helix-turn-helix domain containing protein [Candidatus Atribacteria bacterium]
MVQERCQVMVLHDKKRKIMEAAKQVFAEKSYFEATLENISQISGVKKSTIYYYFGSKLDLMITARTDDRFPTGRL